MWKGRSVVFAGDASEGSCEQSLSGVRVGVACVDEGQLRLCEPPRFSVLYVMNGLVSLHVPNAIIQMTLHTLS